jgi:hypothetical protein
MDKVGDVRVHDAAALGDENVDDDSDFEPLLAFLLAVVVCIITRNAGLTPADGTGISPRT